MRADVLSRHRVPTHLLTVADYYRLGEAGILGRDERVELLEGQLVDMSPIGPRHALAVDALNDELRLALRGQAAVRIQNPITLDDRSEPLPDAAVVRRPWHGYPDKHPGPQDVLLVVEVADSSLEVDQGAKLELYARAGIPEFWIVDLTTNQVHVHRDPGEVGYAEVIRVEPSGTLSIKAFPGVSFAATPLFA